MSAYREGFGPLERRRAEIVEISARLDERSHALDRVLSARAGRIVGGAVGLLGALALPPIWFASASTQEGPFAVYWFFGSAAAAVAAGGMTSRGLALAARMRARSSERRREAAGRVVALRAATDLATLDAEDPWPRLAGALRRVEAASLAVPLAAASLLLPLTAHALVYLPLAAVSGARASGAGFSTWIVISAMVVGHAHVALAICSVLFARKLGRLTTVELAARSVRKDCLLALGITTLVAALPGIVLLAIPPMLAALTGLAVIPLMCTAARRVLLGERFVVDEAEESVLHVRVGVEELETAHERLRGGELAGPRDEDAPAAEGQEGPRRLRGRSPDER